MVKTSKLLNLLLSTARADFSDQINKNHLKKQKILLHLSGKIF